MKSSNRGILIMLGFGLILVLIILALLLFPPQNPSENALPSLVVVNTLSPTIEAVTLSTETASLVELSPSPTVTLVPSETSTEANLEASATHTQAPILQASATNTQSITVQASATSQSANPQPSSTGGSLVIVPQASPTTNAAAPQVPSNTPQGFEPTATLDPTGLVPFNRPINIGSGDLRVLAMTAPADEVMLSLGSSIPAIQANQQWVLIELFLICEGTSDCTPPTSSFSLESSLNNYATTPLNIESSFGDLILNGQILGHIAFVIPRNETPFALELNNNGVEYRFALQ